MIYELIYTETFLKQIKKLDEELRRRTISVIERCRIRPYAHVKKLVGCPYFRLRIGKHRVILDIRDNQLKIFVLEIAHRKNIYTKQA